jgi:hypothetical protein
LKEYSLAQVVAGETLAPTIQDRMRRELKDKPFNVVVIHQVAERMQAETFHREIPRDYLTTIQGMAAEIGVGYPTACYYPQVFPGSTAYAAEAPNMAPTAPALVHTEPPIAPPTYAEADVAVRQEEEAEIARATEIKQEEARIEQLRLERTE